MFQTSNRKCSNSQGRCVRTNWNLEPCSLLPRIRYQSFKKRKKEIQNGGFITCHSNLNHTQTSDLHRKRARFRQSHFGGTHNRFPNLEVVAVDQGREEMIVPIVDGHLARELEALGFSTARLTRALHCSGNASLEAAINWIVEHENDSDIDKIPLVPTSTNAEAESLKPAFAEDKKIKAQQLRERAHKKKEEEEKRMEREREKERIRVGKEILEAKRMDEENERKRIIAYREAEKEEERRAREKILQKLEEDKAERRRKLGLPPRNPTVSKSAIPVVNEKKSFLPVRPATKAEHMRDCLRSLKRNHKDEDARVKRAFQTLLTYVRNVAKNPDEEKFRKIRLSNPAFLDRVGSLKEGVEFLELCGFEKNEEAGFLFLDRDKVNMAVLNSAGSLLISAITNPFFGVL